MIQAFHATFAVGTIVAPWIIAPFITQKTTILDSSISNDTMDSVFIQSQTNSYKYEVNPTINAILQPNQSSRSGTEGYSANSTLFGDHPKQETQVQVAFSIMSIWFTFVAILFFVSYRMTRKEKIMLNHGNRKKHWHFEDKPTLERMSYRIPLLTLLALGFGAYVALESQFAAYLTAFAVKGLHLTKSDGLTLTSIFRVAFTTSRVLNIPVAMCLRPTGMILVDLTVIICTYSVMTFTVEYFPWSIWVGCAAAGFGMGSFFAAAITWTTQNLQITGKAASILNIGHTVGDIVMTFLIGQLFESHGPMSFMFICLGDVSLIVVICAAAYAFAQHCKAKLKLLHQAFQLQEL